MLTYVVYVSLLVFCVIFTVYAEKHNKQSYMVYLCLLLSFIAGFRSANVGIDTATYIDRFEQIAAGKLEYAYGLEEGFKIICKLLLKMCNQTTWLLFVFAFFTNYLILKRMWELRANASLLCMVLCYYIQFYIMTMNVMRQFLAIAVIFYFSRYLTNRKYLRFCVIVLLTSIFIHQSALVGVLYLILEIPQWRKISRTQRRFLCCGFFLSPIALLYIINGISKYEHYFLDLEFNGGIMIPIKLVLFFSILLLVCDFKIRIKKRTEICKDDYIVSTINIYYFTGLVLSMIGFLFTFMDRIGWYFYIFEGCFIGTMMKNKNFKYRYVFGIIYVVLFCYIFVGDMVNKSQGVFPYEFIWSR